MSTQSPFILRPLNRSRLIFLARKQGGRLAGRKVSPEASLLAATLKWDHHAPFDRIIAAAAITRGLTLVSTDAAFDAPAETPKWPGRVW